MKKWEEEQRKKNHQRKVLAAKSTLSTSNTRKAGQSQGVRVSQNLPNANGT